MEVFAKIALALVAAFSGGVARADAFESLANQRAILPGGRAALLGGAFTAVADDASASYYNPAGLAFIKENAATYSATAYQTADTEYKKTINDASFKEHSEGIYPDFIGGAEKFGWLTLGYSFMTLDARNIYQQDKYDDISATPGAVNAYSRAYQESSSYIWTGASAAVRLGDHLSLGTSVFYYQRNTEFTTNEVLELNGGGIESITQNLKTLNTGIANSTGLMWHDTWFAVGVCIRSAQALSDSSTLLRDTVAYDPINGTKDANGQPVPTLTHTRINYHPLDELNPNTYVAGFSLRPANFFLISADALFHEGVISPYKDEGGFDLHNTWDWSAGSELRIGPMGLMLGWFTNNSMYRTPDPTQSGQPVHIDYVGESAGLTLDLGAIEGNLGAVRQTGKGQAQIRSGDTAIQDVAGTSTMYVVAAKVPL